MSDKFERADALQFFDYKGQPLLWRQDSINTFKNKKTLIIDKFFWSASKENLTKVLVELQELESVAFLEPISLKRLLTDGEIAALFLGLHFTKDSRFQWRNNYGHTYEDAVRIIDFMVELKGKTHAALGAPPFVPVMGDHHLSTFEA